MCYWYADWNMFYSSCQVMAFWPIKTKINTSSSTSPRGVPKQKNQHLQFRIEIMLEKNADSAVMWTISRRTCVEHSVSALFKKKSLVSILRKFVKPWGSSSDNSFTKAWWTLCFLRLWIQARTHLFLWRFFLCILWRTLAIIIMHKEITISSSWSYNLCTQWQETSGKWNCSWSWYAM